ncbi:hypothetical protein [Bradyrhizobium lupini]|uniref:hypothetical protein n=1 Tax=Rhizobium lupini TaxID=136996 RepID=UPI0034C693FC
MRTYNAICAAFYAAIFVLIGYGIFKTPTYDDAAARNACLVRPWLDTSNGC